MCDTDSSSANPFSLVSDTAQYTTPNHEHRPMSSGKSTVLRRTMDVVRRAVLPKLGAAAAIENLVSDFKMDAILFQGMPEKDMETILYQSTAFPTWLRHRLAEDKPSLSKSDLRGPSPIQNALILSEVVRSQALITLACWRHEIWNQDDIEILRLTLTLIASLLELDSLHRRIHADAHYDVSSNLLNWNGLREDIERRSLRLDKDHRAATLMLAYIPGLNEITSERGLHMGESALRQCINLLRTTIRPTDAIGRLSGNTFALWLDGGDRFAVAERAEKMTAHGVPLLIDPPAHLPIYLGLVCREAGATHETSDTLLERAAYALNMGLREGVKWRFSHEEP